METKQTVLTDKTKAERISELIQFIGDNKTRQERGWFEHTCDWDPYLLITLENGEVIETAAGYDDCVISNYVEDKTVSWRIEDINEIIVFVDSLDENRAEPEAKRIPIMSIQSLVWQYH